MPPFTKTRITHTHFITLFDPSLFDPLLKVFTTYFPIDLNLFHKFKIHLIIPKCDLHPNHNTYATNTQSAFQSIHFKSIHILTFLLSTDLPDTWLESYTTPQNTLPKPTIYCQTSNNISSLTNITQPSWIKFASLPLPPIDV